MLRHCRHIDRCFQIGIRNRHAEVHQLAAGNHPMHRIEIKQIAGNDLRTHVAQRLRAFVFSSHHRTHRFALLQQQFSNGAPYRANTTRGTGDQNGTLHVLSFNPSHWCTVAGHDAVDDDHVVVVHWGSSVPACSAAIYAAYQSGQFSSRCPPVRCSCSPWAVAARQSEDLRSLTELNEVTPESMRPASRVVISWSIQLL